MQIGVPPETHADEARVSATPKTIKKLAGQGHQVTVQNGADASANQSDSAYEAAGATIGSATKALGADLVLKVVAPNAAELVQTRSGAALVDMSNPFGSENIACMTEHSIIAFALEAAPHTSRAQDLDAFSSQANIAGYKTMMLAANCYPRFVPILMTAAGTVKAVRVLIPGIDVTSLQAIATAERLGAVIEASDARPAVKEQIESLDAKLVDVSYEIDEEHECAKDVDGYAWSMPASWMECQAKVVRERAKQSDIVIITALIPGREAPMLLHEATVVEMKPDSMITDLAAAQGGNCPLTEVDQAAVRHDVTIAGHSNLAALVSVDALVLYARNILDLLKLTLNAEGFSANLEGDIVTTRLMCRDGQAVRKDG